MTKKPITASSMGGLINPDHTPVDTGLKQRGAASESKAQALSPAAEVKQERRSDMMSFKIKPSVRDRIKALSKERDLQIAQIIEDAFDLYERSVRSN